MKNKNLIKGQAIVKKMFFILMSLSLVFGACIKSADEEFFPIQEEPIDTEKPAELAFDAKLKENRTFKVGERVQFDLQGDPETVDFYSGLPGHDFTLWAGKTTISGMDLQFSIRFDLAASSWPVTNPDWGPLPWDKIALLVSTDFDGDFSFAGVKKATWTDVTSRVTFPTVQAITQPAGPVNLSDLTKVGKPVYFAFRMIDNHPKRPRYLIQAPIWSSIVNGERELIGQMKIGVPGGVGENTINFTQIDQDPANLAEVVYTQGTATGAQYNDRFTIRRKSSAALGTELWLVSKKFDDVKETTGDFSSSIEVKSVGNSPLSSWSQVYTEPGTYKAGFVATVLQSDGQRRREPKAITVVVEP